MTLLLADLALDTGIVSRLRAFSSRVTPFITVTTLHNSLVGAVLGVVNIWFTLAERKSSSQRIKGSTYILSMALLTTVAAEISTTLGTITREMSNFTTLLALNTLSGARLGAFLGRVAGFLAVAAGELVFTWIWAFSLLAMLKPRGIFLTITNTMTNSVAVVALDLSSLVLVLVLWTLGASMTELCRD